MSSGKLLKYSAGLLPSKSIVAVTKQTATVLAIKNPKEYMKYMRSTNWSERFPGLEPSCKYGIIPKIHKTT